MIAARSTPDHPRPLGADLAEQRVRLRLRRLDVVVAVLERRISLHERPPTLLERALEASRAERDALRQAADALAG